MSMYHYSVGATLEFRGTDFRTSNLLKSLQLFDIGGTTLKLVSEEVTNKYRELSPNSFTEWLLFFVDHLRNLCNSNGSTVVVINCLCVLEIFLDEKISQEALPVILSVIHDILLESIVKFTSRDGAFISLQEATAVHDVLLTAARVFGNYSRLELATVVDSVDRMFQLSFEWLTNSKPVEGSRRLACVLILTQLAKNNPRAFYMHINQFLKVIWIALNDKTPIAKDVDFSTVVKYSASTALYESLNVMIQRNPNEDYHQDWYKEIWENVKKGSQGKETEGHFGSLLALAQILKATKKFMNMYYKDAMSIVINARSKSKISAIKKSAINLLPLLAAYNPTIFVKEYFSSTMKFLLEYSNKKKNEDKDLSNSCLIAIGEISKAICKELGHTNIMIPFIPEIIDNLSNDVKSNKITSSSIVLITLLVESIGESLLKNYSRLLFTALISSGLSKTLVDCLSAISKIPTYSLKAQLVLMNMISQILCRESFKPSRVSPSPGSSRNTKENSTTNVQETPSPNPFGSSNTVVKRDVESVVLALNTLGSFNFEKWVIIEFIKDHVIDFLRDDDESVRRAAVSTCSSLMIIQNENQETNSMKSRKGYLASVINSAIEKLLQVAVLDSQPSIRETVLRQLNSISTHFHPFLAQYENIQSLFITGNEENFVITELSVFLLSKLVDLNPAYILPFFKKKLQQSIVDLKFSEKSHLKENSLRIMIHSIQGSGCVITSRYVSDIMKLLLTQLTNSDPRVVTYAVRAIGVVAKGGSLRECREPSFSSIISALMASLLDQFSMMKRLETLRTLGMVITYTGYVISPYVENPRLLTTLLDIVKNEKHQEIRTETLKLIGIIGAIGPAKYRQLQLRDQALTLEKNSTSAFESNFLSKLGCSSQEYYTSCAIRSLLRIINDNSLGTYHKQALHLLTQIFLQLGPNLDAYVESIFNSLFKLISHNHEQRNIVFTQIACMIPVVKKVIHLYVDRLFNIIEESWSLDLMKPSITIIEEMAKLMGDQFGKWIAKSMYFILKVFSDDVSPQREPTIAALSALISLGVLRDSYTHLVIPSVVKLFEVENYELRATAMVTIVKLSTVIDLSNYSGRILHPLLRILESVEGKKELAQMVHTCQQEEKLNSKLSLSGDNSKTSSNLLSSFKIQSNPSSRNSSPRTMSKKDLSDQPAYNSLKVSGSVERPKPSIVHMVIKTINLLIQSNIFPAEEISRWSTKHNVGCAIFLYQKTYGGEYERSQPMNFTSDEFKLEDMSHTSIIFMNKKMANRSPPVSQDLEKIWNTSHLSTREDWNAWVKKFSVELLRSSPSLALRECVGLADYYPIVRELFNAAFLSYWNELTDRRKIELAKNLETAFTSVVSPELLQQILDLAEFMEHDDKHLFTETDLLANLALKCKAFAKALHYKELLYKVDPTNLEIIESLIFINTMLGEQESTQGLLKNISTQTSESERLARWYENVGRWEEALVTYEKGAINDNYTRIDGKMRCLEALGHWDQLFKLASEHVHSLKASATDDKIERDPSPVIRNRSRNSSFTEISKAMENKILFITAKAAWQIKDWVQMEKYVKHMDKNHVMGSFLRGIIALQKEDYLEAQIYIKSTRQILDHHLTALVSESYTRAYSDIVILQQLIEMDEIIELKTVSKDNKARKAVIMQSWSERLRGVNRNIEVWRSILRVRSMYVSSIIDFTPYIKFASLCREEGQFTLAEKSLVEVIGEQRIETWMNCLQVESEKPVHPLPLPHSQFFFAYLKQLYGKNPEKQKETFELLNKFSFLLANDNANHRAKLMHILGRWQYEMIPKSCSSQEKTKIMSQILNSFQMTTQFDPKWRKGWHSWALMNFEICQHYQSTCPKSSTIEDKVIKRHLLAAINGFIKTIELESDTNQSQNLQDLLRFLSILFDYGNDVDIEMAITVGINNLRVDTWLEVIPQIIARMHVKNNVGKILQGLLIHIGKSHPQALVYPLSVATMTPNSSVTSMGILDKFRLHSELLVDQATKVAKELIRVAILWPEMWYEAIEDASRCYFGDVQNIEEMFDILIPLQELLDAGPSTPNEIAFYEEYSPHLNTAFDWLIQYQSGDQDSVLTHAWEIYHSVFHQIEKQMSKVTTLELDEVSPRLLACNNMELAIPGTYKPQKLQYTRIASFVRTLDRMKTKQHPRKLGILSEDGMCWSFLLKGHEDLRQDERVMQLLKLVSSLLKKDVKTKSHELSIEIYPVIPLSTASGLLSWVKHSDTLHELIKNYRESRNIPINLEHTKMKSIYRDFEKLCIMGKLEAFEKSQDETKGEDLDRILWLNSPNSEVWMIKRSNFSKSLAVMSMVGYILGLGDRHPSNIMMHKHTGKVIHIDFGDCFEVAIKREKFPEKIPFRLTRMLTNAMEVYGVEGLFKTTCINTLTLLRENSQSIMAVLEAFIHDPLITWRLLEEEETEEPRNLYEEGMSNTFTNFNHPRRTQVEEGEPTNQRALEVIDRIKLKLCGRDFQITEALTEIEQVEKLIKQSTSVFNLCQCYPGWCPFW